MKHSFLTSIVSASLIACSSAAMYSTDFESFAGPEIAGTDGWTISDSTFELSFNADVAGSNGLGLGGFKSSPANDSVSLSHSYVESVGRITATFNFGIVDSTDLFPDRDSFGFSLNDGSGSLFKVFFKPDAQVPDPESVTDASWTAFYSVNGIGENPLALQIFEDGAYSLSIELSGAFTPGATTTELKLTLNDGIADFDRFRTLALNPLDPTTDFSVDFDTTNGAALAGDNFIGVDNLTVVPEPSSALLLTLAGLGLVSRRRRA